MLFNIIAIAAAYLLGSISVSILLSQITKSADPRTLGSGNAGATNVLRNSGKKQALIVLICDMLKGVIAVVIGQLLGVHGHMLGLVAFAAVFGHVFPLFYGFRGGKGVATTLGVLLTLAWPVGLICLALWIGVALLSRYSSLGSLVASVAAPFLMLALGHTNYFATSVLIAALVIFKHAGNIQRLKNGQESKIRLSKS